MGGARPVWGRTLRMLWEELFVLVTASGVWTLLGLAPALLLLAVGGPILGALGLILTLPPATAGLYFVTNRLANDYVGHMGHVWQGARQLAKQAWILGGLNAFVAVVAIANFQFYNQFDAGWVVAVRSIWFTLLLIWIFTQLYAFPLLLEQKEPRVRLALRNSLFLAFASPGLTFSISLFLAFLIAVTIVFLPNVLGFIPILLIFPSIVALLTNVAVVQRLKDIRGEKNEEGK